MTEVQKDRLVGFNASLKMRGVVVSINSAQQPADLNCLVEPVDSKSRDRLQVIDVNVTHVIHAPRVELLKIVDAMSLASISLVKSLIRPDSGNTYRVTYFQDDPQRPAVLFYCVTNSDE